MRIATLMINGFGEKLPRFRSWLKKQSLDVVALQKIGNETEFPTSEIRRIGYRTSVIHKAFPKDFGVAVLTRDGLGEPKGRFRELPGAERDGSRLLTVEIAGMMFSSVYAPYGPITDKPTRRIEWLEHLHEHLRVEGYATRDSLLCGDFNVKSDLKLGWKGAYTRHEQRVLNEIYELGFCDLYRRLHPDAGAMQGFTFGFGRHQQDKSKGTSRLHLAVASNGLAKRLISACVDAEADIRQETRPLVLELT